MSEDFQTTEWNGLRLTIPSRNGAVSNSAWNRDTLHLRSRVETLAGELVSQGYKKFFNLGQGPLELAISVEDVVKACENRDVIATLKLDGSLLIRSVYQGQVMLRTRGSFGYEFLDNAHEIEYFRSKYPSIFDPDWYPQCSLLFEWTSPENIIVIKYPEPELTLLGAISHIDLTYMELYKLKFVAEDMRVPLVEHFPLTKDGWTSLQESLETDTDIEGFVLRLHGEQNLVKIKAQPYLTKHGLKSTLTTDKLADMFFQQGQPSFKDFCETFVESFDEETLMWALGAISSLYDGVKTLKGIVAHMTYKAKARAHMTRKDAALAGMSEYGQTKRFAAYMNLWEGRPIKTEILKSILLQSSKQVELDMFKPTEITGD